MHTIFGRVKCFFFGEKRKMSCIQKHHENKVLNQTTATTMCYYLFDQNWNQFGLLYQLIFNENEFMKRMPATI